MANNDEARMPSGQGGGLVQYFEADNGIEVDPKTVIGMCGAISVILIALNSGMLGI